MTQASLTCSDLPIVPGHQVRPERRNAPLSTLLCTRCVTTLNAFENVYAISATYLWLYSYLWLYYSYSYVYNTCKFFFLSSSKPTFVVANSKHHVRLFLVVYYEMLKGEEHGKISSQDSHYRLFSIINCIQSLPCSLRTWWPASCHPFSIFVILFREKNNIPSPSHPTTPSTLLTPAKVRKCVRPIQ